ncbi:addiction module protein [Desulfomicrobium baculatum]|jgi:putative addiction module component (TIGR02574 family)|uniref:Addiction module component, TIGR02574 family n=1 Tax=Desulfomicrobium baculatum (strain DSM 4028 / VKM B-1378 / X) TaxID=525897 RepID=C7LQY9_DESBD|nr:addiction module protein [Desulfomicrobium baculatum]ACU89218.1 addiction module component, TIGR02574 family [Desulfomicrobium baculatum DSM 4028]
MTATTKLTEQLLSLPCEDRIRIVEKLLESLNAPADEEIEQAWAVEAERRIDELNSGTVRTIPGEEVFADIRQRLGR